MLGSRPRRAYVIALGWMVLLPARRAEAITRCDVIADAQSWVDAQVEYGLGPWDDGCPNELYCDPLRGGACYRTDCSGFVSATLGLPAPGQASYYYAGGTWDNGTTEVISPSELQPGDILHRLGIPGVKAGHVMLYVSGDFASGFVETYEELSCGKVATRHWRSFDPGEYLPVRYKGIEPCQPCEPHCEGTVLHSADCGMGDCGAYGAICVNDDLGARCAWPGCPSQGQAEICVDQGIVGSCDDGALVSTGDCSAYAAYCSTAGGQTAHCVSAFCVEAPTDVPVAHDLCFLDGDLYHCDDSGGLAKVGCPAGQRCSVYPAVHCAADNGCPPDGDERLCVGDVVAWCLAGGLVDATDCSAQGFCSTVVSGTPHCVSSLCVEGPGDTPVDHLLCLANGMLGRCHGDGTLEQMDCAAGELCRDDDAGVRCEGVSEGDSGAPDAAADASEGGVTEAGWDAPGDSDSGAGVIPNSARGEEPSGCACGASGRTPTLPWTWLAGFAVLMWTRRRS